MMCVTGPQIWFRGTLDQTLLKRVLGAKSAATSHRARSSMRPAKGWVKEHKGQYYDLHVKNGIVKICLV